MLCDMGAMWRFSSASSADVRSLAAASILASLVGNGILKLCGSHFNVCTIRSCPVCLI